MGYNYGHNLYAGTHEKFPERVILSSETFPARMASNWNTVLENDYVIGDFHWTAWDYLGEAGVGLPVYGTSQAPFSKSYPAFTAACGSVDLIGQPESAAIYTAILWGTYDKPYIGVRPVNHSGEKYALGNWRMTDSVASWTWPGCEGRSAEIEVFSPGTKVALHNDGQLVACKPLENCKAVFCTPYHPGTLTAIAYGADGAECGRTVLQTAGTATQVVVAPEESAVRAGDIFYVPMYLADAKGALSPAKEASVTVEVEGAGRLLALGSARPDTTESYQAHQFTTYRGRLLAVVLAEKDGQIQITANTQGVANGMATIQAI